MCINGLTSTHAVIATTDFRSKSAYGVIYILYLLYGLLLTAFACAVVDFCGEAACNVFHLQMVRAVMDVPTEQVDDVICLHDSLYIAYQEVLHGR